MSFAPGVAGEAANVAWRCGVAALPGAQPAVGSAAQPGRAVRKRPGAPPRVPVGLEEKRPQLQVLGFCESSGFNELGESQKPL